MPTGEASDTVTHDCIHTPRPRLSRKMRSTVVVAVVAVAGVAWGGDEADDPAWGLEEVAAALYRFERVNDFFVGKGAVAPPEWWAVRNASDVRVESDVMAHGMNKKVSRGTVVVDGRDVDVVVKAPFRDFLGEWLRRKDRRNQKQEKRKEQHGHRWLTTDPEFGDFYTELCYLEFLRGQPGVPTLYGGWYGINAPHYVLVIEYGGDIIGGTPQGQERAAASVPAVTAAVTDGVELES